MTANPKASNSLLSLVPRSVVLARLSMTASNGSAATTKLDKKLLLQSICRYLKTNGFSKTVKKLKSEAEVDEGEFTDSVILDLEEICAKHLETRTQATEAHHVSDQELEINGVKDNSTTEKVSKKKKKAKNGEHTEVAEDSGIKEAHEKSTTKVDLEPEGNTKEKKKSKKSSANVTSNDASEKIKKSKKIKKQDSDTKESPIKTSESKKRKRVPADDDSDNVDDASPDVKSKETGEEELVAMKTADKLVDAAGIKDLTNSNNGYKSSGQKSAKKQRNGSAEPTTVKAFQRVKVDEVVITDERLKDNSYWAKDGAETGYGAKAQEILGQVRGKDFRHEKTKKKRGSYRGGHIDFDSHSIKFNNSDDE